MLTYRPINTERVYLFLTSLVFSIPTQDMFLEIAVMKRSGMGPIERSFATLNASLNMKKMESHSSCNCKNAR